ncbi:energy-coupling factor transporter transmembrane protein EcfT [bacterium]|nr:energy-coupling factor transporter transmembrane protein EcfT [bacterium]
MSCAPKHGSGFVYGDRPRPRFALAGGLLFTIAVAALPAKSLFGLLWQGGLLIVIWLQLRPRPKATLRLLSRSLPVLVLITAGLPFFGVGEIVGNILGLSIYADGLRLWSTVLGRGLLALLTLASVMATIGPGTVIVALDRLRLPRVIVALFSVAWLQLHLLQSEARRRQRAIRLRSFDAPRKVRRRSMGGAVSRLFRRSLGRADRLFVAMRLRGDGSHRFTKGKPARLGDWLFVFNCALAGGVTLWLYLH